MEKDNEPTEAEIEQVLWELYSLDCEAHATEPTVGEFIKWKEEEGYDEL